MEISKEIKNIVNNVNFNTQPKPQSRNLIQDTKVENPREGNALDINTLRLKVGGLQKEMNQMQTAFSRNQVQLALLSELEGEPGWQKKFGDAMRNHYGRETPEFSGSREEMASGIESENQILQAKIIENSVKQENLFASGLVDPQSPSIARDAQSSQSVFAQMKLENIQKLLSPNEV